MNKKLQSQIHLLNLQTVVDKDEAEFCDVKKHLASPLPAARKIQLVLNFIRSSENTALAQTLAHDCKSLFVDATPYQTELFATFEERVEGFSEFTKSLPPDRQGFLSEMKKFWAKYPIDQQLASVERAEANCMSEEHIVSAITAAVESSTPFSLVRMGDGEGRFVGGGLHGHLGKEASSIAKRIWFWNSTYPHASFWTLLDKAYLNADVVGYNPPYRLRLALRNSSIGYTGVVLGNNFILDNFDTETGFKLARNWVLASLGKEFFVKLISRVRRVGFIGPHGSIGKCLLEMGAWRVDTLFIPSDNIVPNLVTVPHYPDFFNHTVSEIRRGVSGLWLVSAGALGKIFCDEIKRAGGIALDIGSLSDQWMGLSTR